MSLTILHTADLHLGAEFPGLGERGPDHREQLKRTFARIVDRALALPADLLLIAGDLFDSSRQSAATVGFVRDQFLRLGHAGIPVGLLAGNHDPLGPASVWARTTLLADCETVTLFGAAPAAVVYPRLDLTLIGQSVGPDGPQSLRAWPEERQTRFAIGLAHGSAYREGMVEGGTIHPTDVRRLGLDYLALGDWHTPQQVTGPPTPAWYPGAPEFLAMDQEGGRVLVVRVEAPGKAEITPEEVGRRRYRRRDVDISGLTSERIRARLADDTHPDVILDVVLTGVAGPENLIDARELEDALGEACFRVRVRNQSSVWLDQGALEAFPERTLVGRFIRNMRERADAAPPDERAVFEEALQMGVARLLSAEDG